MSVSLPRFTAEDSDWAALTSEIRAAIYAMDRGQPCVCSDISPCMMHAGIKRAEEQLAALRALCFLSRVAGDPE